MNWLEHIPTTFQEKWRDKGYVCMYVCMRSVVLLEVSDIQHINRCLRT